MCNEIPLLMSASPIAGGNTFEMDRVRCRHAQSRQQTRNCPKDSTALLTLRGQCQRLRQLRRAWPITFSVFCPDRRVIYPDRRVIYPDRRVICPDRRVICRDRRVICRDRRVFCPDRRVICPDHRVIPLSFPLS
jgi:hypothetical protein